jgi:hypothetical protein
MTARPRHLVQGDAWTDDITEFRFVDESSNGDHGRSLTPRHIETIDTWSFFDASLELVTRIVLHVHPEIQSLDRKVYDRIAYLRRKKRGFGLNDHAATYKQLQTLSPQDTGMVFVCGKDPDCRATCPGIEWHAIHRTPLRCECQNEPFTAFEVFQDDDDNDGIEIDEVAVIGTTKKRTASHRAAWSVMLVYCTSEQRQRCITLTKMNRSMVCDTTFGVTSSGHRLTAIVCVNEFNRVELMASFVTDTLEKATFEKCFDAWRRWMIYDGAAGDDFGVDGYVWHPHSFVVDCHDAQLAALKKVFGETVRLHLCSVHVQRAINNRLHKTWSPTTVGSANEESVCRFRRSLHALLYTNVRLDEPEVAPLDLRVFATRAIQTLYKDVVVAARSISTEFETYIRGEWGVVMMHMNATFVGSSVQTTNAIESYFNGLKTKYVNRRRKRSRHCYDLLDRLKSMALDARSKTQMPTNIFAGKIAERMSEDGAADEYDTRTRSHSVSLVTKVCEEYDTTSMYVDERASRELRTQIRKCDRDLDTCLRTVREKTARHDAALVRMRETQAALHVKKSFIVHTRHSLAAHSSEVMKLETALKTCETVVLRANDELRIAHSHLDDVRRRLSVFQRENSVPGETSTTTDVVVHTDLPEYLSRIRDVVGRSGAVQHAVNLEEWKCTCSSADTACPGLNMCVHRVEQSRNTTSIISRALSFGV